MRRGGLHGEWLEKGQYETHRKSEIIWGGKRGRVKWEVERRGKGSWRS
jgi:hypothetical protein